MTRSKDQTTRLETQRALTAPDWIRFDPFFNALWDTIRDHKPKRLRLPGFRPAAVLLLFWRHQRVPHLLFIRRSDQVRHHKGEISFPGGSREPRDRTLLQTALRETHEEIGIPSKEIQLLGRLDDAFTLSRYRVSPFAAALKEPHPLHPNREVAEVIPLPVARLFNPERFSVDTRVHDGEEVPVYTYEVCRRVIWGATARILKELLDHFVNDTSLMQALEAE